MQNITAKISYNTHKIQTSNIDSTIMFLLIACTGIPFFYRSILLVILATIFCGIVFIIRENQSVFSRELVLILFPFFIIHLLQSVFSQVFPITIALGIYLRVLFAYFAVKSLKLNFIPLFIKTMVVISFTSFFFYFPAILNPTIKQILLDVGRNMRPFVELFEDHSNFKTYINYENIIIYDLTQINIFRNSGPFWEPGAFGGFLIIAIMFNVLQTNKLVNFNSLLLYIATLTTLSTTAYLALFLFVIAYLTIIKRKYRILLLIPIFILIGNWAWNNLDFMKEKMDEQTREFRKGEKITQTTRKTRFASGFLDFETALNNPIIGSGISMEQKYSNKQINSIKYVHRNNGTMAFLSTYGFIFTFWFFYWYFMAFYRISYHHFKNEKIILASIMLIIVLVLGFSEVYFGLVCFYAFPMLYLTHLPAKK